MFIKWKPSGVGQSASWVWAFVNASYTTWSTQYLTRFEAEIELAANFSLDDRKNLNRVRDKTLSPAERAGACLQISSYQKYTKSYQQHSFDWPRYCSKETVRLPVNIKYVKWTNQNWPKLNSFPWIPFRTISLHALAGWDNISIFAHKRKHGMPKFLQREHSYLTNDFWAQMALAALTNSFSSCR